MLERMNTVQRHRGPDGNSLWISDRRNVGLGHTRLAIIGLENGQQPICNEDRSIFIVVNGEFYGYEAIRRDLEDRGHCFRTESDSEIAVHLYEEYGLEFVSRLRGEFALILWDERNQTLHAVRDRFGIKPLFHTELNGKTVFASEIKALLRAGKQAQWDYESFWSSLHFSVLPDRTWFKDIRQVAPGHLMTLSADKVSLTRYWDFSYPCSDADYVRDESGFVEEFEETLCDSVRLRTRADVAVGAQLSGGMDSTTVVATASRYHTDLQTFTVRFPNTSYDEWDVVAKTAQKLNLRSVAVVYRDSDLFEFLKPAGFHAEWIQENSHGIARFILSKAIHDGGFKVVLAGEGADELLGGYAHFQRDLDHTLSRQTSEAATRSHGEHGPFRQWLAAVGYVPAWMSQRYYQIAEWVLPLLADDFLAQLRPRDPFEGFLEDGVVERIRPLSPFHQALYVFNKTRLPNYILVGERLDMAHSVEVRLPYLDHHLFDCASRMPLDLYRRNGQEKFVLRQALRRMMSTEHMGAKRPFLAPPRMKQDGAHPYRYFLDQIVASRTMKDQPFFSQGKLQTALRTMQSWLPSDSESAEAIWQMVIGVWLIQAQFVSQ
jgi:asparagine synthase (glutamine-hydrolysing)